MSQGLQVQTVEVDFALLFDYYFLVLDEALAHQLVDDRARIFHRHQTHLDDVFLF